MRQVLQAKEKIENQTRIEKYMMLVEKGYVLYYTHQCPINAKYVPVVEESAAKNGIPFKAILLGNKEEAGMLLLFEQQLRNFQ